MQTSFGDARDRKCCMGAWWLLWLVVCMRHPSDVLHCISQIGETSRRGGRRGWQRGSRLGDGLAGVLKVL